MQRARMGSKGRRWLGVLALALLLWWGRALVWLAVKQLFLGMLTAFAAMPLMRRLEKRLPACAAAALSVAALLALLISVLVVFVPVAVQQGRKLFGMLPDLWSYAQERMNAAQLWLAGHGIRINAQAQEALLMRGQEAVGSALPAFFSRLGGVAGGMGQWLLAPAFGFYFLRDRRMMVESVLKILPERFAKTAAQVIREIRHDTAAYLRGQMLLCVAVGALSAVGLLLCGIPSWLALGVLVGALEWIPYAGPLIGAAAAALFALPLGLWRTLWAVGVMVAVQQLESSVLSPRFISRTTQLHPAAVILCTVLGGAAAGVSGIILAVPLVLCIRAALRVLVSQKPLIK